MARTVDSAFSEYMRDYVNLDSEVVSNAKASKNNLLENIHNFSNDDFFNLCPKFDIEFGSFARKTKCRELDDIDLMIGISADGATYNDINGWDDVRIYSSKSNDIQQECTNMDGTLNSISVLNKFREKLKKVPEYNRSEKHRNGEAVTLNLISKDWSFDVVPCLHTVKDENDREYYLIPNLDGNWKKTDPKMDSAWVNHINNCSDNKLLPLIRLFKKWNENKRVITLDSYLMETMIVNFAEGKKLTGSIKVNFIDALQYLSTNILFDVNDMKWIQGNINNLNYLQKKQVGDKAKEEANKALEALGYEIQERDMKKAINKWREIFGEDFPRYE